MVKRRRSLPPVSPRIDREIKPLISAITEILEVGEGVRGDPRDRKLTIRDLVDLGLARARSGAGSININNLEASLPELAQPDMATPPSPSGLGVSGGFNGLISLVWDIPGTLYGNHAYTNIYRAEEDNFANAVKVGAEAGAFFTDNVRADAEPKTYYYWITFVSTADVEGPTNATAGTTGQALQDVAYLLETLTNNLNDAPATLGAPDETLILHADRFALRTGPADDPVYPMVVQDINGTPTVVLDTAIIRDGAIQEGKLGPVTFGKLVASDGVTPITTVGGLLKADYIDVDNLSVAEAATFTGIAQSTNFATGLDGWLLHPNGQFEANNATFRGHVEMKTGYIADSVQIGGVPRYQNYQSGNFIRSGATITSSAAISDAAYLSDGVREISANYWTVSGGTQYLQADLGSERYVSENRMFFYALDGRRYKYAVAVSTDGNTWEYVVGSGPTNGGNATGFVWSRSAAGGYEVGYEFPTITPIGKFARYVRVWMNGNSVNTSNHGYEWELYGSGGGGDDPYVASIGSLSKNWVKPGFTWIDGTKIYTGDAYVDTLQIKGNAVTVPAGASRTSAIGVGRSWTTIASFTYNHGYSGSIGGLVVGFVSCSYFSDTAETVQARLLVNGSVVGTAKTKSKEQEQSLCLSAYVTLPSGSYTVAVQSLTTSMSGTNGVGNVAVIGGKR